MKRELLLFILAPAFFLGASADDEIHNHDSHLHQKLVDGENLEVDPERYKKFLNGLTDSQVAVVSVKGMVCDFCARGIEKTFIKDKTVKKIDVDLNQGKVLIAYEMDRKIDFEEVKAKIVMNGQNATAMKVLKI